MRFSGQQALIISTIVDRIEKARLEERGQQALIISTIVDEAKKSIRLTRLVGSNNFYYCRFEGVTDAYFYGLVGSNNFYYCRLVDFTDSLCDAGQQALIISTIVDINKHFSKAIQGQQALIISTIVDTVKPYLRAIWLVGSNNFYYCR